MSRIKGTNYHPHSTAKASQWPSPSSIGKQEQDSLYSRKKPMTMRFSSYEAHDKDMLYSGGGRCRHARPTQRRRRALPPNVSISIDSGAPITVTVPVSSEDLFFNVTDLPVGQHTVKFTVLNFTDDFPFALDAVVYAGPTDVTVPVGSSVSSQQAGTSGFLQGLIPADLENTKSSGPPVGPIVGGVIGGTALLAMIGLVVWYMFIRPRRRGGRPFFYAPAKISDMLSSETADAKPDPYPLMAPTNGAPPPRSMTQNSGLAHLRQPTLAQSDVSLEYSAAGPESVSGVSGYGYGVGMGATPLSMSEAKPLQSKAELAAGYTTSAPATFHADSGIRFPPPAAAGPSAPVLSDVPPTYSEK
ncbi:hypothetical protein C2E23DRAFT_887492 [Lenzites betulinus]|nr:hypothetical protein C2E23DRAFT_887492 [Lenzites betulinus]